MSAVFRPRRSLLFMPGSNPRALEKARALPADGLIIDLEDAVPAESKEEARAIVAAALAAGGYGGREIVLRVNPLDTPWGHADLAAAATLPIDAVLLPKVESAYRCSQHSASRCWLPAPMASPSSTGSISTSPTRRALPSPVGRAASWAST